MKPQFNIITRYKLILFLVFSLAITAAKAQELDARITINSSRVGTQVNKNIFQTLQKTLNTFLNNRKWTKENFRSNEKITCSFLLNINQSLDNNVFQASLTVQAARPVFNSSYQSALVNFLDDAVTFRYVEFQPVEFNENRVAGNDAVASNLTAVLAYYVYIIIGMDFDSFSMRGGDPYFQKAQNIVTNAPDGRDISGWRAFDGLRNRYWLTENLMNSRYSLFHDAIYSYYRLGMDNMYENEAEARSAILNTFNLLTNVNTEAPNTMFIQFFFQGKSNEIIKIFKKAPVDEKGKALELLSKLDITNSNTYKQELK